MIVTEDHVHHPIFVVVVVGSVALLLVVAPLATDCGVFGEMLPLAPALGVTTKVLSLYCNDATSEVELMLTPPGSESPLIP